MTWNNIQYPGFTVTEDGKDEKQTFAEGGYMEVRLHEDGTVDEVVVEGKFLVHNEQLDDHLDYIAYYFPNDKSGRLKVTTTAEKIKGSGRVQLIKHHTWERW